MALQTLATTANAEETATAAQALGTSESSGDTGGLLNSDGPQPLVPAFILSALVVVGIIMMCWWKRVSARRASASRAGVVEEGAGMNMVIGAGRGLSAGMVMLAARGTELPTQMEVRPSVRRKKDVKLGPKPLLWDIYLERDDELDEKEMKYGWRWMTPLSASHACQRPPPVPPQIPSAVSPTFSIPPNTTRTRRRRCSKPPQPQPSRIPPPRPPQPQLRVSVLISMPSPRASCSGQIEGRKRAESSSSSSDSGVEKEHSPERRQEDLGECNLVLGIMDVPFDQRKDS